jgi:nucleotide-binding universal stress UspA family protein
MASWRRVLCATDLSPAADEAIRHADEQARLAGAALSILHVLPTWPGAPMAPENVQQELLQRERLTADLLATIGERVTRLTGREGDDYEIVIDEGLPADAIVRRAKEWSAELVVIGGKGRSALAELLLGSVAEAVTRGVPCSVLVVRFTPR